VNKRVPFDSSKYGMDDNDSIRIGYRYRDFSGGSIDDSILLAPSRNKTRIIPKHNYDITEIPIQKESS
jgi:hypothetical protein